MRLALWLGQVAAWLLPRLPEAVVLVGAEAAAWLAWLANRSGRRAVRANLRVVLGRLPTGAEVRAVFRTAAQNYGDLFRLPALSRAELLARVEVEGWEHLQGVLDQGRGALVASLHLGNIEVVGYAATCRGIRVMLPVEHLEPPEFLDFMVRLRARAGLVCEPVGQDAFDRVRAALAAGAVVGIGADRITLGAGEVVPFCGRPARMPIAAALLALRTGAPLLAVGIERRPGQRFHLRVSPPLDVAGEGRHRERVRRLTEQLLAQLEVYLRANPTQWVVFRPIWEENTEEAS